MRPSVSSRSRSRREPSWAQASTSSTRLAVLAGQGGDRRPTLADRGQAGGVDVEPGGVRRHVGRQVGQQVGELGQPVGELAGLGVVVADALEQGARGGGGGQRVGGVLVAGERLAGLLGGGAQGVGVAQPRLLGRQGGVLAGLRGDRLDLPEAEAEPVGLLGALAGVGDDVVEVALDVGERRCAGAATAPAARRRRPRRTGRGRRAGRRPGAGGAGRTGRGRPPATRSPRPSARHGHGGAADPGAGASLGGDVAGDDDLAVLGVPADLVDRRAEGR